LGYSADQSLLVVLEDQANGYFYTYSGINYGGKLKVSIADDTYTQVSPSSFSFSPNNDLLAVGTKEGGVYGFKIDTTTKQLVQPYAYFYRFSNVTEEEIRSVDIAKDGKIAFGSKSGLSILSVPATPSNDSQEFTKDAFFSVNSS